MRRLRAAERWHPLGLRDHQIQRRQLARPPAEVQYRVDGTANWIDLAITGIGATADPTAIDIVGDKLVVVVTSENAYYYATINASPACRGRSPKLRPALSPARRRRISTSPGRAPPSLSARRLHLQIDRHHGGRGGAERRQRHDERSAAHSRRTGYAGCCRAGQHHADHRTTTARPGATPAAVSAIALAVGAVLVLDNLRVWSAR